MKRGRWRVLMAEYYYSYQTTDADSYSGGSDLDSDVESGWDRFGPGSTTDSTPLGHTSPRSSTSISSVPPAPILAPDCSACGIRLDYIRYVCQTCGEGDMWKTDEPGKAAFIPPTPPSESSEGDGDGGSDSTSTQSAIRISDQNGTRMGRKGSIARSSSTSTGTSTARSRSPSHSISTQASRGSGSASGGHSPPKISDLDIHDDPSQPHVRSNSHSHSLSSHSKESDNVARGYELCAGCIEVHGIAHAKAATKKAKASLSLSELRERRRAGELRHTFREKIWGAEGWIDVGEYLSPLPSFPPFPQGKFVGSVCNATC